MKRSERPWFVFVRGKVDEDREAAKELAVKAGYRGVAWYASKGDAEKEAGRALELVVEAHPEVRWQVVWGMPWDGLLPEDKEIGRCYSDTREPGEA